MYHLYLFHIFANYSVCKNKLKGLEKKDIIDKSGAWYSYKGERIGQGRENVKNHMLAHPEMVAEVSARVRDAYGIGTGETFIEEEVILDLPEIDSEK